jgi:two-component system, OmpR family, response regulator
MRVLLVEDNPHVQNQLCRTLQGIPGAQVVQVAGSEAQATEWLQRNPQGWDLALVDLFLGDGHGFRVLKSCRERSPHQRAIVVSNYTREPVRDFAVEAGADAVFDKTFDMEALVDYLLKIGTAH